MPAQPPEHAEPGAESFSAIVAARRAACRSAWRRGSTSERILCVSHWGFLHFFLGASIFREAFAPAHLPALYRMSHINTGITLFQHRRDYLIEGVALRRLGAADLERPGAPLRAAPERRPGGAQSRSVSFTVTSSPTSTASV